MTMESGVRTLNAIADHARHAPAVRREDLAPGDRLVVTTRNSVYSLLALGDGEFIVQGGWFDKNGESPAILRVNGCTYGGTAIRPDVLAARGLFLEFANQVVTTRIRSVRVAKRCAPAPAA
jgi:hypothetical protein